MSYFILSQPTDTGPSEQRRNRIPRPMNAFMLFANQYRTELIARMPEIGNKRISEKLGEIWNTMTEEEKDIFFKRAKLEELEHYQKYPDYRYLPNTAREKEPDKISLFRPPAGVSRNVPHQFKPVQSEIGHTNKTTGYKKSVYKLERPQSVAANVFQIPRPIKLNNPKIHYQQEGKQPIDHKQFQGKQYSDSGHNLFQGEQLYDQQYPYQDTHLVNHEGCQHISTQEMYHTQGRQLPGQDKYDVFKQQEHNTELYPHGELFSSRFLHSLFRRCPQQTRKITYKELQELCPLSAEVPYTAKTRDNSIFELQRSSIGAYKVRDRDMYHHQTQTSYKGTDLDTGFEPNSLDDENERADQSLTSEMTENNDNSENTTNSMREEETNYVMIPCDVNIAKLLGWPVHLLQRVSRSTLYRIQQESILSLAQQGEYASTINGQDNRSALHSFHEPSNNTYATDDIIKLENQSTGKHNTNYDDEVQADMPETKRRCLYDVNDKVQ